MDILWIVLGIILMIIGILGCVLPIIPGPPIAYVAILIQQLKKDPPFDARFLTIWALVTAGVTILDYVVPIYGTKRLGGTKKGMWGATIGLILGILFFPPVGLIVGPFIGAYIGELIAGKDSRTALKSGFGSFLGFVAGTLMKLVVSVIMAYYLVVSFV